MRRWLFRFCSAFSLLICTGMLVLGTRSYRVQDYVDLIRINPAGEIANFHMNSFNGGVEFEWSHTQAKKSDPTPWRFEHETGDPEELQVSYPILSAPVMGFEFVRESSATKRLLGAVVPYWAVTLVFALVPIRGLIVWGVKKYRLRAAKPRGFEVMPRDP